MTKADFLVLQIEQERQARDGHDGVNDAVGKCGRLFVHECFAWGAA